jgi:DNA-binding transcriptional ArsR family regulator
MSKRPNNERQRQRCCQTVERLIDPKFFKALGDPNRIAIVARLARCCGSYTVSRVAECCTIDLSVVSRHLVALRDAGIVDVEKRGKEVYYSVRFPEIAKTLRALADAIEACCPMKECDSNCEEPGPKEKRS